MHPQPNMIKLPDMKVRGLYLCQGRNYSVAIWDGKSFLGPRYKFEHMVGVEQHYDSDPHFGTVCPYTYVKQVPEDLDLEPYHRVLGKNLPENPEADRKPIPHATYCVINQKLMDYLLDAAKEYKAQIEKEAHERYELFKQSDTAREAAKLWLHGDPS